MIRRVLRRWFDDPERDKERAETEEVRQQSAEVDREARRAIERAQPTGMILRDILAGTYDPNDPIYRGRRTQP